MLISILEARIIKRLTILIISIVLMMSPIVVKAYTWEDWAEERIEYIEQDPYYEDCTMLDRMKEPLKRSDLAYVMVKAYELMRNEKVEPTAPEFQDTSDEWVLKARTINLVAGYGDNIYKPEGTVKKEEFIAILSRTIIAAKAEKPGQTVEVIQEELKKEDGIRNLSSQEVTVEEALVVLKEVVNPLKGKGKGVVTLREKAEQLAITDRVKNIRTTNKEDEWINFEIVNNKLYVTGDTGSVDKSYIRAYLKDEINNEKEYGEYVDNNCEFSLNINLGNIKESELYHIDICKFPKQYGTGKYIIYENIYLTKEGDEFFFLLGPAYYVTKENYNPNFYREGSFLGESYNIQTFDPVIQEIAKEIVKGEQDDYKKARLIHDWVAENIYYNWDAYNAGTDYGDTSAKGVLTSSKTVCEGYANLTAALMRAVGIPCKKVSGRAGSTIVREETLVNVLDVKTNHAWNEAYIDGRWVIIDVTWDSGNDYEGGQFQTGETDNDYFDPTLEFFGTDHCIVE